MAVEIGGLLDWWTLAGVDCDYADDATAWLAPAKAADRQEQQATKARRTPPRSPAVPSNKKLGGNQETWPETLEAFHGWWTAKGTLDDAGSYPILPPLGGAHPQLMVLVPEPEEGDTASLLSGPQGRLIRNILAAMGIDGDQRYIAAALRRHTPMPDWDALKIAGLGAILTHHIAVVRPKRILALGRCIPPLLGHDMAQGSATTFQHLAGDKAIPAMCAGSLSELLRSATRRQRFWAQWLEWTTT